MRFLDKLLNKIQGKKSGDPTKKLKVGLIINEFFGGANTPYGGYGMLARNYICKYIANEDITIDVLLCRRRKGHNGARFTIVDGTKVYKLPHAISACQKFLKKKNYDLYLSIESTFNFVFEAEANGNKKLLLWIQDPRPSYEWDEINTVKLCPEESYYNQAIYDSVHEWAINNRVSFVSQARYLNPKAVDLYRLPQDTVIDYLPNPIDIDSNFDVTTYKKKNQIVFLARIESVKRGWIFCEIAKRVPEYEFIVLGKMSVDPKMIEIMAPYKEVENLRFAGHVEGEVKAKYLKDAKILVNTSIHDALPIAFLEAMSYGTLLVSNRNPDELTSKFGVWTGDVLGDGFDKVDLYADGIRKLMTDEELRYSLSIKAVEYIKEVHNIPRFVNDLTKHLYKVAGK